MFLDTISPKVESSLFKKNLFHHNFSSKDYTKSVTVITCLSVTFVTDNNTTITQFRINKKFEQTFVNL